jgi:type II secretory pathway predicted ATPase ExeA
MNFHQHWSLLRSPFSAITTQDAFFSGNPQREAIARLDYMIQSSSRSAVMLSHRGCGATTLLKRLASTSGFGGSAIQPVMTTGGVGSKRAALARLAVGLSIDPFSERLAQKIEEAIRAAGRSQVRTLWLIDRCDAATAEAASTLASCSNSLSIVLGTTLESAPTLQETLDYCPLRIDLDAFHLDDTIKYVRYAVASAGAKSQLFDDSAIVRLHELTDGRIAMIAAMAELALMAAANVRAKTVHADFVEAVQSELVRAA